MTDQPEPETPSGPESNSKRMSRLIRETPPRDGAQLMRESIARSIARRKNGENK
ncbi:hypothetical protein [Streptomyces sp. NPDC047014]|uniref:hypothetical protein n=1 Tax=Streptomyces sp. NPDC047014 TaxID=3155736 RepID=UPI0033E997CA